MKELLFVINTMGLAGAEKALIELLRMIPSDRYHVSLLALIDRGELFSQVPPSVTLLNRHPSKESVLGVAAQRYIRKRTLQAALRRCTALRLSGYLLRNYRRMKQLGRVQPDKLLWRMLSDGAPRFDTTFDLAVAYLEGGATYYVADHVKAAKKVAFVHIDYQQAGYGPMLDCGCYDAFDRICCVSKEAGARFAEVYPAQQAKLRLFHNLLDEARIRRLAAEGEGFSDDFDGKRIVSVGRLHPQKAYPVAIAAMRILKNSGRSVRWYVLGEGAERPALEALIAQNGLQNDFVLLGAKNNPYPYMAQADLYVHATLFEGKSVAIEEAQVLGKTIIASDCTGNREQIVNGENGLLIPVDAQTIADTIARLLDHPDEAARLAARSAYRRTDQDESVRELLALTEEASS